MPDATLQAEPLMCQLLSTTNHTQAHAASRLKSTAPCHLRAWERVILHWSAAEYTDHVMVQGAGQTAIMEVVSNASGQAEMMDCLAQPLSWVQCSVTCSVVRARRVWRGQRFCEPRPDLVIQADGAIGRCPTNAI